MLQRTQKVVVFGGGSFGTAVGSAIARQKADLAVSLLLRDPYICKAINETHRNTRYLAVGHEPGMHLLSIRFKVLYACCGRKRSVSHTSEAGCSSKVRDAFKTSGCDAH